jgi:hypothetical protein
MYNYVVQLQLCLMMKLMMRNYCTSFAGHFDGHCSVPVQYEVHHASPNAACIGLLWKLLDAAIGQLLSLYCPSGRRGNTKQNNNEKMHQLCWSF